MKTKIDGTTKQQNEKEELIMKFSNNKRSYVDSSRNSIKNIFPFLMEFFVCFFILQTCNPNKILEVTISNFIISLGVPLATYSMVKNISFLKKKFIIVALLISSILFITFYISANLVGGPTFNFNQINTPYLLAKFLIVPAIFSVLISKAILEAWTKNKEKENRV